MVPGTGLYCIVLYCTVLSIAMFPQVDPYPHTFTSKLKPVNCIEKDTVEFDIDTEAADAEVTWYQGNRKIVVDGERVIAVAEVNDPN